MLGLGNKELEGERDQGQLEAEIILEAANVRMVQQRLRLWMSWSRICRDATGMQQKPQEQQSCGCFIGP